jgi:hypothetical protein
MPPASLLGKSVHESISAIQFKLNVVIFRVIRNPVHRGRTFIREIQWFYDLKEWFVDDIFLIETDLAQRDRVLQFHWSDFSLNFALFRLNEYTVSDVHDGSASSIVANSLESSFPLFVCLVWRYSRSCLARIEIQLQKVTQLLWFVSCGLQKGTGKKTDSSWVHRVFQRKADMKRRNNSGRGSWKKMERKALQSAFFPRSFDYREAVWG